MRCWWVIRYTLRSQEEQVVVLANPEPELGRLFQRHLRGYRVQSADTPADAAALALEIKASALIADLDAPTALTPARCR